MLDQVFFFSSLSYDSLEPFSSKHLFKDSNKNFPFLQKKNQTKNKLYEKQKQKKVELIDHNALATSRSESFAFVISNKMSILQ